MEQSQIKENKKRETFLYDYHFHLPEADFALAMRADERAKEAEREAAARFRLEDVVLCVLSDSRVPSEAPEIAIGNAPRSIREHSSSSRRTVRLAKRCLKSHWSGLLVRVSFRFLAFSNMHTVD